MPKIITSSDEKVHTFYSDTIAMLEMAESLKKECKPTLCGRHFYTDTQLSEKLNITKRALQDYRDKGIISFYRLDGKILYSDDDIDVFLKASYRPKFD